MYVIINTVWVIIFEIEQHDSKDRPKSSRRNKLEFKNKNIAGIF